MDSSNVREICSDVWINITQTQLHTPRYMPPCTDGTVALVCRTSRLSRQCAIPTEGCSLPSPTANLRRFIISALERSCLWTSRLKLRMHPAGAMPNRKCDLNRRQRHIGVICMKIHARECIGGERPQHCMLRQTCVESAQPRDLIELSLC